MKKFFSSHKYLFTVLACVLLLIGAACTQSQINNVVGKINGYIPTVQALNTEVTAVISALDPPAAVIIGPIDVIVNNALTQLQTACGNYLAANASSSAKVSAWNAVVQIADTLVKSTDAALLKSVGIKNSGSQAAATVAIGALDAAFHLIDGWISTAQPAAAVQAKLARRTIKLEQVARYWSPGDKDVIAHGMHTDYNTVYQEAVAAGF